MDRYLLVVFDHLKLRVIHANPLSAQSRFAENNNALTCGDHFLHVMQIEPAAYQRLAQSIRLRFLQCCLEDFFPTAKPAERSLHYLAAQADGNIAFFPREMRELPAILVTSWKMRKQIFDSLNSEPSQRKQARTLDPVEFFKRHFDVIALH